MLCVTNILVVLGARAIANNVKTWIRIAAFMRAVCGYYYSGRRTTTTPHTAHLTCMHLMRARAKNAINKMEMLLIVWFGRWLPLQIANKLFDACALWMPAVKSAHKKASNRQTWGARGSRKHTCAQKFSCFFSSSIVISFRIVFCCLYLYYTKDTCYDLRCLWQFFDICIAFIRARTHGMPELVYLLRLYVSHMRKRYNHNILANNMISRARCSRTSIQFCFSFLFLLSHQWMHSSV